MRTLILVFFSLCFEFYVEAACPDPLSAPMNLSQALYNGAFAAYFSVSVNDQNEHIAGPGDTITLTATLDSADGYFNKQFVCDKYVAIAWDYGCMCYQQKLFGIFYASGIKYIKISLPVDVEKYVESYSHEPKIPEDNTLQKSKTVKTTNAIYAEWTAADKPGVTQLDDHPLCNVTDGVITDHTPGGNRFEPGTQFKLIIKLKKKITPLEKWIIPYVKIKANYKTIDYDQEIPPAEDYLSICKCSPAIVDSVPYLNQYKRGTEEKLGWGSTGSPGGNACGPTSVTMLIQRIFTLTGRPVPEWARLKKEDATKLAVAAVYAFRRPKTPDPNMKPGDPPPLLKKEKYSNGTDYYKEGELFDGHAFGTNYLPVLNSLLFHLGLNDFKARHTTYKYTDEEQVDDLLSDLKKGYPVAVSSLFRPGGHWFVITGQDGDCKWWINDPAGDTYHGNQQGADINGEHIDNFLNGVFEKPVSNVYYDDYGNPVYVQMPAGPYHTYSVVILPKTGIMPLPPDIIVVAASPVALLVTNNKGQKVGVEIVDGKPVLYHEISYAEYYSGTNTDPSIPPTVLSPDGPHYIYLPETDEEEFVVTAVGTGNGPVKLNITAQVDGKLESVFDDAFQTVIGQKTTYHVKIKQNPDDGSVIMDVENPIITIPEETETIVEEDMIMAEIIEEESIIIENMELYEFIDDIKIPDKSTDTESDLDGGTVSNPDPVTGKGGSCGMAKQDTPSDMSVVIVLIIIMIIFCYKNKKQIVDG